ncbi:radical SAM protein [uncultured Tateyamaria sp.]|uniref:B12-binding domain-containing radical SAM protein n=1 Tax=uncultured Tateyamaria sp. TaxID=455651 RepID=UPI0026048550|nr:radical SAM protein [uncultured Tateyamaria sp.]
MKLLLVDNILFEGGIEAPRFDPQPHLGLMSLVAVAHQTGFDASILNPRQLLLDGDLRLDRELYGAMAEAIAQSGVDAVGFTALGCNIHCVVQIAQALKKLDPDCPVLLGGPHATILHRELLEAFSCFDIIARHEAEHSLPLVLKALDANLDLGGIPGITFRSANNQIVENAPGHIIEDLDLLPVPDYDAYPLERFGLEEIRVEAGRGCPFSCTFCSTATFFGRQYRLKSPERLVSEMDKLYEQHGFTQFKLNHDLFTVNRKMVLAFCEAVRTRRYQWSCSARMDCVDPTLLEAMAKAGCNDIYFGVEAGSARMQEITKKRLDLNLIAPTLAETSRLKIKSTTSFIAGYPQEEQADLNATLDAVGASHLCGHSLNQSQLHLLTPEPGTELMNLYEDTLVLDQHVSEFNFPRLAPDDDALLARYPKIFPNHHHFQTRISRKQLIFVTDLWPILYELERPILARLISAHNGSLSSLANNFYDWASDTDFCSPSLDHLAAYIANRFGAAAPVSSIARFEALKTALLRPEPSSDDVLLDEKGSALRLSPEARLLPACHDVPALLTDSVDAAELSNWILLRKEGNVRLYSVGEETLSLLGLFQKPASYEEIILNFLAQDGPVPAPEDLAALVDLGALERVSEVQISA